jgi:hypothetical protein
MTMTMTLPTLSVRWEASRPTGAAIFGLFAEGSFATRDFNQAAFAICQRGVEIEEATGLLDDLIGRPEDAFDVSGSGEVTFLGDCAAASPFDDRDWRSCPCADCADERDLERAKASDPERWATL